MPTALRLVIWVAAAYLIYGLILFLAQRRLLFPTHLLPPAPAGNLAAGVEAIRLETEAGPLPALYLPPVGNPPGRLAPAAIFAHGNAERVEEQPSWIYPLSRMGLGVLLLEYPGYGAAAGHPSQETIRRACLAAYDWLRQRPGLDPNGIVLFGRSLGGGAVCQLSLERPAAAMILLSCFTSARAFARRYLAPACLVRDPFDNLAAVRQFAGPVLILHGRNDEIIPFAHARTLHQAAARGTLIAYPCGHNDCPPDPERFWQDVSVFLADAGLLQRTEAP